MATPEEQITPADAAIVTTGTGRKGPEEHDLPESLKYDMDLCLEILRNVLGEYNPELLSTFDTVRHYAVEASAEHFAELKDPNPDQDGLKEAVNVIDNMTLHDAQLLARAFATYFHLANLSEENYRVSVLHERENNVPVDQAVDPINELTVAYHQLINETGPAKAKELLNQLEFHPVFTAHPTEARRKAVEGKIRRVSELLEEYERLGGSDKKECLRRLYNEIDALFRTSPIALKKPTPVEEADTILDIFDNTLFNTIPKVYRRFDDWVLGDKAGLVEPACPAFFHPGSWIGSDRDGNPNVTAKVSRAVARKFSDHVIAALEEATRTVGRNLTMEAETTPPSAELKSLWSHQKEMSERLTDKAALISTKEMHRAVMLVMADRLHYTIERDADLMYHSCDDFLADLKVVQRSLAAAGAKRSAYGPLQDLIWQTETFGFHMVEMEFRQHSVVHARALADIREHGLHGERGELQPMTHEVLDTFRALGAIQKRNGLKAARRYIISFTKSAQNIKDVYELNRLAFSHPEDVPTIDVIPLFEQLEDLQNSVDVLEEMIKIPEVQARLKATGNKLEVMLGYSDSSKDAGPTSATLALHSAQERIAKWAESHDIDLTLFHGRGGAVGRGGGARPAGRFRQVPLQAHRAGRGHLRPLRQPGAGHPPRRVRGCGDLAAVRAERGEAQHRDDREVCRHGRSARRGRAQPLPRPVEHRRLCPVVLDRYAADRNRPAADRLPPGQAWPRRQVARRPAHDSVDLLLGPGPHQPGRLVRSRHRMREVRRSGDHASGLRGMAAVLHLHRQHRDVHRQDG